MYKRIVIILNRKAKEQLSVTWPEALQHYRGYATFEEFKEKYKGADVLSESTQSKRKRSIRNN